MDKGKFQFGQVVPEHLEPEELQSELEGSDVVKVKGIVEDFPQRTYNFLKIP